MILDKAVYRARRERLMERMGPRAVALFRASPEVLRNGDSTYPYRPSSDLLYLTGFAEPECALVLRPGAATERVVLFVRPRDPERETWEGRRAGPEGAIRDYGVEMAYPIGELGQRLPALLANWDDLHYSLGLDREHDAEVAGLIARLRLGERRLGRPPKRVIDPRITLHELRLHKTPEEIAILEQAARITGEGHLAAMRAARPGVKEYELAAAVEHAFRRHGAVPGYPTIVGGGSNATVLHYVENSATIEAGQLVLIDAGAEWSWYTADVTRTFPCGGRFSPAQRRAYEIVLSAQEEAVAMTRPGVTLEEIHERVVARLTEGMVALGLLDGPARDRIADGSYRRYYMHRTSHWLGLDVHDAGAYADDEGRPRPLAPGMVITIEPGLYVAPGDERAPAELRGLGIRIEDDVLVTDDGHRNLTAHVPKQPDEIEQICTS